MYTLTDYTIRESCLNKLNVCLHTLRVFVYVFVCVCVRVCVHVHGVL